jgi:hypothetical protein
MFATLITATSSRARKMLHQKKPWLPSPRGGRFTDPDPTTPGWSSVWLTATSARRPPQRRPLYCPHPPPRLPRGPVRILPRLTSRGRTPGRRSPRCQASGPRPASRCLAAARCPPLCSHGAAPAADREAAPTPHSRKARDTVREPPAGRVDEPATSLHSLLSDVIV